MKIILPIVLCLAVVMLYQLLAHEDGSRSRGLSIKRPNLSVNREKHETGDLPRTSYVLSDQDVQEIKSVGDAIEKQLPQLKKSDLVGNESWYQALYDWTQSMKSVDASSSDETLLDLVEFAMKYNQEYFDRTDVSESLRRIGEWMYHLGPSATRLIAKNIEANHGELDPQMTRFAIEFFSHRNFQDSSLYGEDEIPVLDSAGILIAVADQDKLLDEYGLGKLGGLTSLTSAEAYFHAYVNNGFGMDVLKDKFSVKREQIERLYKRVVDEKRRKLERTVNE